MEQKKFKVVGQGYPRHESMGKATGKASYTDDLFIPNLVYGAILRSPYPHARVIRIDKSGAEKLPGVEAVITFEDVPKKPFSMVIDDLRRIILISGWPTGES